MRSTNSAREGSGDILVFLPGEREIRETAETLRKHQMLHSEVLPLYARLQPGRAGAGVRAAAAGAASCWRPTWPRPR